MTDFINLLLGMRKLKLQGIKYFLTESQLVSQVYLIPKLKSFSLLAMIVSLIYYNPAVSMQLGNIRLGRGRKINLSGFHTSPQAENSHMKTMH